MGEIDDTVVELLKRHRIIGLDTMLFIYSMEERKPYISVLGSIFYHIEFGFAEGVTSTITLAEILVKPIKDKNHEAVKDYKFLLHHFPHLMMVNIDAKIAEKGAELRAKYGIRTPDALKIASAVENQATVFLSNDCTLKKIREIEVRIINEIIGR